MSRVPGTWISVGARFIAPLALACIAACTTPKDRLLPQGGATMSQIYAWHSSRARQGPDNLYGARRLQGGRWALTLESADLHGYTRDAANEIQVIFPLLPNPTFALYVDPHLTADGHPVPGYSTVFSLYDKAQYALPGEARPLPPRWRPTAPLQSRR